VVIDLTGQTFGKLIVTERDGYIKNSAAWKCTCLCGKIVTISAKYLTSGTTKSCGCYRAERGRQHFTTHGLAKIPEYKIWVSMKQRCFDVNSQAYADYGGRGITVCERWKKSFLAFYHDMGPRPSADHSIDREENDGDYEPDNCRWATYEEQNSNQRKTRRVEYEGKIWPLTHLVRHLGVPYHPFRGYLYRGYSVEDAIRLSKS
jgi:hypothetical protein